MGVLQRVSKTKKGQTVCSKDLFILEIARICNLTRKEAKQIFKAMIDSMVESLKDGDYIWIRGFGKWYWKQYKERTNSNFGKGTTTIPAKKRLVFKRERALRALLYDDKEDNPITRLTPIWRAREALYESRRKPGGKKSDRNRRYREKRKLAKKLHALKKSAKDTWS